MTAQNTPAYADNGSVEDVDPLNTLGDLRPDEDEDLEKEELDDPAEDPAEGGEDIAGFDTRAANAEQF